MLYDVSRATIVTPDEATAAPVAKNGRAKASASNTSVATRRASRSSCRSRRFRVCSTGACRSSFTAENFTLASGSRFRKCKTSGTAAAAAPSRNRGERKDNMIRPCESS